MGVHQVHREAAVRPLFSQLFPQIGDGPPHPQGLGNNLRLSLSCDGEDGLDAGHRPNHSCRRGNAPALLEIFQGVQAGIENHSPFQLFQRGGDFDCALPALPQSGRMLHQNPLPCRGGETVHQTAALVFQVAFCQFRALEGTAEA